MIAWEVADLPPGRTPEEEAYRDVEAWRRWRVTSCEEWTGGHAWTLELDHDEEYGPTVQLGCEHCPAGIDDVWFDAHDLMCGFLDDVTVQDGSHDSPVPVRIPVEVDVLARRPGDQASHDELVRLWFEHERDRHGGDGRVAEWMLIDREAVSR